MQKIIDNSILEAESLIGKKTSLPDEVDNTRELVVKSILEKFKP